MVGRKVDSNIENVVNIRNVYFIQYLDLALKIIQLSYVRGKWLKQRPILSSGSIQAIDDNEIFMTKSLF